MPGAGTPPREEGSGRAQNLRMLGKLVVVACAMFAFGFALVPLYNAICEVTGLNYLTKVDRSAAEFARNTQVDKARTVVVEFDANSRGAWQFRPEVNSLTVHPGELVTIEYDLVNTRGVASTGQAIPSYAPQESAPYFRKLECFCFRQQALAAHESRRFPVVFVIDPKLPKDVTTITLSYTFFEVATRAGVPEATGAPQVGGAGGVRGG
ncbi:MAG: cytochrome c oxidase assembly protein [Burkholderiales bacterium]|nr:cytochrome c oxidase assembly protein [Burkholderiales bacterium]